MGKIILSRRRGMKIVSILLALGLACCAVAAPPQQTEERQFGEIALAAFTAFIGSLSMQAIRQFNNQAVFIVNKSGKSIDIAVADPGFPNHLVEYSTVCSDKEHNKVYAKKTKLGVFGKDAEVTVKGSHGSYRMPIGSCRAWSGSTFVNCTKDDEAKSVFGVKNKAECP